MTALQRVGAGSNNTFANAGNAPTQPDQPFLGQEGPTNGNEGSTFVNQNYGYGNMMGNVSQTGAQAGQVQGGSYDNTIGGTWSANNYPGAFQAANSAQQTYQAGPNGGPGLWYTTVDTNPQPFYPSQGAPYPSQTTYASGSGGAGGGQYIFGGNGGGNPFQVPSDEQVKTDIKKGDYQVQNFLDAIKAHSYEYKSPEHGVGRFVSPMAQELEKTEVGKSAVVDTPKGKMVDYGRLGGIMLAAQAMLNERVAQLEKRALRK